jgi:uncharacterized protein YcbK (DUF882 family)
MISLKELLNNKYQFITLPKEHQENLKILLEKINQVRLLYGKPMIVTSGYRSMEDHLRIYAAKGITDKSKIPMQSKHLIGAACDIADPKKELQTWILNNLPKIEAIGLWMEDFNYTPNWVHFQILPPKSNKRFFIP